ncbi:hypothetical protein KEJ25_08670 [Candidatus Bathyarchaeota archaeon]|nr:hypothetical protein [Candidatus Bathyarchaeota archaeon]
MVNILEKTYETYGIQIKEIVRACRGDKTRAGEIIAWFYGTEAPESF